MKLNQSKKVEWTWAAAAFALFVCMNYAIYLYGSIRALVAAGIVWLTMSIVNYAIMHDYKKEYVRAEAHFYDYQNERLKNQQLERELVEEKEKLWRYTLERIDNARLKKGSN